MKTIRHIQVTYELVTEEGETYLADEMPKPDVDEMIEFEDNEDYPAVAQAAQYLQDEGCDSRYGASNCPWRPGSWYLVRDETSIGDEQTESIYHLSGFSEDEERRIAAFLH